MSRYQYHNLWSLEGRLPQVTSAMKAVKLGTAVVGLKNWDTAVLVALLEQSASLHKVITIDDHVGLCISGLTADAGVLTDFLRSECEQYRHDYDSPYPMNVLMTEMGIKMQASTQRCDRRPYGVELLVAGYDEIGPHIYQVQPSAKFFNCKASAIGSRSDSARAYLARRLDSFLDSSKDELICHGINAILATLPTTDEPPSRGTPSKHNITVAIVGNNQPFQILSEENNERYLQQARARGTLDALDRLLDDDDEDDLPSTSD